MTSNDLRECPFPLLGLCPPYDRFHALHPSAVPEATEVPGFITVLEVPAVPRRGGGEDELRAWIPALRRAGPRAPVVARLAAAAGPTAVQVSAAALRAGARATLMAGEPAVSVSASLTDPAAFANDVAEWLEWVIPGIAPRTRSWCRS